MLIQIDNEGRKIDYDNRVEVKHKRLKLLSKLNKIKIVLNMRIVHPYFLLRLMIEKIQIVKDMFVQEISLGNEVLIPRELSQDNFPMSFRYYDFILNHVMDNVSNDTQTLYAFKNDFRLQFYKVHKSLYETLLEQLGMNEDTRKLKTTNKMALVETKNDMNHFLSQHTYSL